MKTKLVVIPLDDLEEIINVAVQKAIDKALKGDYPEWISTSQALKIISRKSSVTLHKYCDQYNIRRKYENNIPYFNYFDLLRFKNLFGK